MTRDEILALLRELALYGNSTPVIGDPANMCALCKHVADRVRMGEGDESYVEPRAAHEEGCKLAAAIAWLEDETNCVAIPPEHPGRGGQSTAAWPQGWVLRG